MGVRSQLAILLLAMKFPMNSFSFYIVEDEPLITATIANMLKKQGYKVMGDSEEHDRALLEIELLQPDIVLLDIRLEGKKDGIELALELDKLHVKYIFLSSLADSQTMNQLQDTNPLGFIDKPFTEFGFKCNISRACLSA